MKIIYVFCLVLQFFVQQSWATIPEANNDTLSVSMGIIIYSAQGTRIATAFERIHIKDSVQIFINPSSRLVFMLFQTYDQRAELVSSHELRKGVTNILPALNEYYQFDGEREKESLLLVLVENGSNSFDEIFNINDPSTLFHYLSETKKRKNIIESDIPGPKIHIGGNVRDAENKFKYLNTYRGKNIIIKEYNFYIKN